MLPDPSAKEAFSVPEDKPRVTPKGAAKALARRQRRAEALRENLKKRKRQIRARKASQRQE
jgi:hypothetical protein